MGKIIEIRWHGRAGQGVVTAAQTVAELLAAEGKYVQGFPDFGAEKRGAPIMAFNRISDSPVRIHSSIENPNYVVVADPSLIGLVDLTFGSNDDTVFIFNATFEPSFLKEKLSIKGDVFSIDATGIALEEIGRGIPNIPLVTVLINVMGLMKPDALKAGIKKSLEKRFNQTIVESNLRTVDRALKEVKKA